ncbi:hypothetical protein RPATATE_0226 [Rickettsia parkeri str. Tate's Hell]|uniref:Uncharacterized protein n=1 Tax=Rickettsia parkeri str. Tate's Hell TaxID=1359189 RepID=A0ABR5DPX8_RICPA|nr:hypothetical protein RPAAT24_0697 [Rickettsia parkeri str. AT\
MICYFEIFLSENYKIFEGIVNPISKKSYNFRLKISQNNKSIRNLHRT